MSSLAGKRRKELVNRRLNTFTSIILILEEEAKKKTFWQRLKICNQYLWKKKFDVFFQE